MHILSLSLFSQYSHRLAMVPTLACVCMGQLMYAADAGSADADVIVITAQKSEKELYRVAGTVLLIDDTQIKQTGRLPQLTDALKGLPGVSTYNTGGFSGAPSIRLRGASNSGTQIIKDGIPFNDPSTTQGNPNMNLSSDAGVKSIEVAMGPQSTLYGSKAIGGVVHLIPLSATEESEGYVRVALGSFATRQTNVQATGPINDKLGYAIGYASIETDGVSVQTDSKDGDPEGHEDDAYNKNGLYLRADYRPIEGVLLSLIRDESRGESEFDSFGDPDDSAPFTTVRSAKTQLNADIELPENFLGQIRLAQTSYDRETPNAAFGNKAQDGDELFASIAGFYDVNDRINAALGYDSRKEKISLTPVAAGPNTEQEATHQAVWAQGAYSVDGMEADASLRAEDHSIAESATTWHLGTAGFFNDESIKIHSSVGTAFRAPSLYELNYGSTNAANLKPEESLGFEIGVTYFYNQVASAGITAWKTDYTNRIVYTGTFGVDDRYENDTTGADVTGYDIFGDYLFVDQDMKLSANATFQNPEETTVLEARLPETMINLKVTWSPEDNIWASFELQYTGTRKASSFASVAEFDAYTLANISLGYQLGDNIIIDAQIRNAFDENYVPADPYSGMPRHLSVGVTAEF